MNRRKPVTAAKMREVKDNLKRAMTTHARNVGRMPDVLAVDRFLDPILRQVEAEHEEDRTADMMRPEPRVGPAMKRAIADPGVRLINKPGHLYLASRDGTARAGDGVDDTRGAMYKPGTTVGDDDIPAEVVQERLRILRGIPAWRDLIQRAWLAPHEGPCALDRPCETVRMCVDHGMRKVNVVLGIVRKSFAVFGDPRQPVATAVIMVP